jgi:hypothetical protein
MNIQVTFELLLTFLIPGILALLAIAVSEKDPYLSPSLSALIRNPTFSGLVLFGSLSLSLGAIIDLISGMLFPRVLSLLSLFWKLFAAEKVAKKEITIPVPENYLSLITKDNLEVFQALLDRTLFYERLSRNTCLAVLLLAVSRMFYYYKPSPQITHIESILLLVALLLGIAAYEARGFTIYAMSQFSIGNRSSQP